MNLLNGISYFTTIGKPTNNGVTNPVNPLGNLEIFEIIFTYQILYICIDVNI